MPSWSMFARTNASSSTTSSPSIHQDLSMSFTNTSVFVITNESIESEEFKIISFEVLASNTFSGVGIYYFTIYNFIDL